MGDVTQDTMAAIELVQQLQKVKDLDPLERYQGDTDGSSIYSDSTVDRSHPGTATDADSEIPEKPRVRRPRRQGHLSLDRVFRKRFHRLKKELEVCPLTPPFGKSATSKSNVKYTIVICNLILHVLFSRLTLLLMLNLQMREILGMKMNLKLVTKCIGL